MCFASFFFQDGKGTGKAKDPPPPFSGDLFIRRVHLIVGEVLKTLWSDPRLPSLPHDAVSRVLAAVHEVMQSLQVRRDKRPPSPLQLSTITLGLYVLIVSSGCIFYVFRVSCRKSVW